MNKTLKRYLVFNGRLSREDMLLFFVFIYFLKSFSEIIFTCLKQEISFDIRWLALPFFLLFYPITATAVRRLHDLNRASWWIALPVLFIGAEAALSMFMPILYMSFDRNALYLVAKIVLNVIGIAAGFFMLFKKGTLEPNQYGPSPLERKAGNE